MTWSPPTIQCLTTSSSPALWKIYIDGTHSVPATVSCAINPAMAGLSTILKKSLLRTWQLAERPPREYKKGHMLVCNAHTVESSGFSGRFPWSFDTPDIGKDCKAPMRHLASVHTSINSMQSKQIEDNQAGTSFSCVKCSINSSQPSYLDVLYQCWLTTYREKQK